MKIDLKVFSIFLDSFKTFKKIKIIVQNTIYIILFIISSLKLFIGVLIYVLTIVKILVCILLLLVILFEI